MSTSESTTTVEGSCLCKTVRYTVAGPYMTSAICHCKNCQKISGSAFMANAFYPRSQFSITQGAEMVSEYKDGDTVSGNIISRNFCSQCGSPLFILHPKRTDMVVLMSGAMEDPKHFTPKQEYYTKDRRAWLNETEGVQAFETARTS